MSIPAAYAAVIIIWSTTPLAVKWSAEGFSPIGSVLLRVLFATVVGYLILLVTKKKIRWDREALRYYVAANIGIFMGMSLLYIASTSVPSGLISILFGLSPVLSGILSQQILNDSRFTASQWVALLLSFFGLILVFSDQLQFEGDFGKGAALVMVSVVLFSLSGVLMKRFAVEVDPLSATVGALTLSLPLFGLVWLVFDRAFSFSNLTVAITSIIYLGVGGSLLGFASYYYILKNMSATYASLVTLITPVMALCLGNLLNGELISLSTGVGAGFISAGLLLFTVGNALLTRKLVEDVGKPNSGA